MFNRDELEYIRIALEMMEVSIKRAIHGKNVPEQINIMYKTDLQHVNHLLIKVIDLVQSP